MKKRLLITSIVMMLVCAVALSTATYAWFTSNASVSASTMTLRAGVSDAAALGIGWTNSPAGTYVYTDIKETLQPMAPKALDGSSQVQALANGQTYEYESGNLQFYSSTVKQEQGVVKFNNTGANVKPVVYTQNANDAINSDSLTSSQLSGVEHSKSFYIRNLSKANTVGSITVSAVFPAAAEYTVTKDDSPQSGTTYYTYNGSTYSEADVTGGFLDSTTYYVKASQYILTSDETVNSDAVYYTKNGDEYTKVTGTPAANPKTAGYYEKLTGDDMIRVALFKQEYRYTDDTSFQGGTDYYWYNPTTNVIELIENPSGDVADFGYKVFEKEATHTLLGVLGKTATTLVPATGNIDKNTVYYTVSATKVASPARNELSTYFEKVNVGTDQVPVYNYVKTDDFDVDANHDYYTITKVADPQQSGIGTYFTAANTVANGDITINGPVKNLNYYTGVTTEITFAEALKPDEQVDFIAVVWLDGTILDDTRSSELAQVSLLFEANN